MTGTDSVVVPVSPSTAEALAIETVGSASSFWIVPIPCASAIAIPPVAFVRFNVNVSSSSARASSAIVTATAFVVWPGVNVSVPDFDV